MSDEVEILGGNWGNIAGKNSLINLKSSPCGVKLQIIQTTYPKKKAMIKKKTFKSYDWLKILPLWYDLGFFFIFFFLLAGEDRLKSISVWDLALIPAPPSQFSTAATWMYFDMLPPCGRHQYSTPCRPSLRLKAHTCMSTVQPDLLNRRLSPPP